MSIAVKAAAACVVIVLAASGARAQDPNGPEFQANTYTTDNQTRAAVAADRSGHFVVVWQGRGLGYDAAYGRRYTSSGAPLGPEFRLSSDIGSGTARPAVGAAAAGNFVAAWEGQDGSSSGVFARRFDALGVPLGPQFQVNTTTTFLQYTASVAVDRDGSFVVAWESDYQDGDGYGVVARRYDAAGLALGPEFVVSSYTTGQQYLPKARFTANGEFVVVWQGRGPGDGVGIFARRFDASGNALGGDFLVNSVAAGFQGTAAVGSDASGAFVVVWADETLDGSAAGIFGRRYDATGSAVGGQFPVNSYTIADQNSPAVAADTAGSFMVTWWNGPAAADGSGRAVRGRQFDAGGSPVGSEFRVNAYTTGDQDTPVVASGADGAFVVLWQSGGQDGSEGGVFGRRYGDFIFADTFDSGALSFWSATSTDGGDLSVTAAASMASSPFGLQALVDDTAGVYVQDDAPANENRYRVRFYFDPNGFDPGESAGHLRTRILIGFEEAPTRRLFALVLRRQAGSYSLRGRVRQDDDSQTDTAFFPISNAPHYVELDWQRASGPDALDGTFHLWIDGGPVAALLGLDNSISAVDFARMGALSVKIGATGTMYWDEFESRRRNPIGVTP